MDEIEAQQAIKSMREAFIAGDLNKTLAIMIDWLDFANDQISELQGAVTNLEEGS